MTNILIIGFGNMGQAIGKTLAKHQGFRVFAHDKHHQKIKSAGVRYGELTDIQKYDAIIIAVKPQDVPALAGQLAGKINSRCILISIAAGLPIKKLAALFSHTKIVRMMPNLGLSVGQGIAAWKTSGLSANDKKFAKHILNSFTENFEVDNENLIDATTAISGSGPAYFFFFADALLKSAQKLGLTPTQSRMLVKKTMSAAVKLQEGQNYQELIKKIRSKKGTTDAALKVFKKRFLDKTIGEAVTAAFNRARELSRM